MGTETQASIYEWMNATFPGTDPESPRKSLRALEEMVELCLACGATERDVRAAVVRELEKKGAAGPDRRPDKIPSEAADVVIVLYGVAGINGFDLHKAVDAKMRVNRARKWNLNGDGTGYHIKEG